MTHLVNPTNGAIFLLLFGALVLIVLSILRRRKEPPLHTREVAGLRGLEREIERAAESANPVHVALGTGGLSSGDTITSLAGLQALEGLVDAANRDGGPSHGAPPRTGRTPSSIRAEGSSRTLRSRAGPFCRPLAAGVRSRGKSCGRPRGRDREHSRRGLRF